MAISSANSPRKFWQDPSMLALILTNLVIIIFALIQQWNLLTLIWIYWTQGVIIGLFNFLRIILLKNVTTYDLKSGAKFPPETIGTKIVYACFFLLHYGGFQAVYAAVVWNGHNLFGTSFKPPELLPIFTSAGIFLVNHLFSFIYHFKEATTNQEIGALMAIPYTRMLPTCLIVIVMTMAPSSFLIIFLFSKAIVDIATHTMEYSPPRNVARSRFN
jgi:hypothetical protein